MATSRRAVIPVLVGAVVLFGAGLVVGALVLGNVGEAPCWQVQADVQAARDTMAETFGSGSEGREAMQHLLDVAEARPDCFSPSTRDLLRAGVEADEPSGADEATPGTATVSESPTDP